MARVAIIDGFQTMGKMLASVLREGGHEVLTEVIPVDFERILHFGPQVIVVSLYRMNKAFDRPIESAERDVLGFIPLISLDQYPALNAYVPVTLLGTGLHERDIPENVDYDLFLSLPKDIEIFRAKVEELASKAKGRRRRISRYACPHCGSRLTYTSSPDDLFCPRCQTVVAILDDTTCMYVRADVPERSIPCRVEQLLPPAAEPREPNQKSIEP
ncbi:MAG TPA: hypothetical protein V6D05_09055 [Stenomitos sp.]